MRRTVLVVDDDAATRKLYQAFLGQDYDVRAVDSGVGAVELVEREPIDVVVMDLNLPGLDGWMAMSLIRARRPNMPFLVVTSLTDADLETRAKNAGASAFLRKPITKEMLSRAVDRGLPTR